MKTLDLRKKYRAFYTASAKSPDIVDVPELTFLMVDGRIEQGCAPGTSAAFRNAVQVLYGSAYTLKFMSKLRKTNAIDYPVMALEAIWWVDNGAFDISRPGDWRWRAMIMQPDHITPEMLAEAREQMRKKKPEVATDALRLEKYREGLCVQMMHVGPYATEPATVGRMLAFAAERGLKERLGWTTRDNRLVVDAHHEIYLGDPRRSAPEKLKTVLRHPIARAERS
jgi:hypothetical protein